MELTKASALTHVLMHEHGLSRGWTFRWQNKKRSLGTCSYNWREIRLSKWYVELNDLVDVKDTILHEIAHALAYERYGSQSIGHGFLWKKVCREIGAIPKSCSKSNLNKPTNHHKYVDTCCGLTFRKHRLRKNRTYSCPKCHVGLFISDKEKKIDRATKALVNEIFSA